MSQVLYGCNTIDDFKNLDNNTKDKIIKNKKKLLKTNVFLGDITTKAGKKKIRIKTFDLPRKITCIKAPMVDECKYCYQEKVELMHKGKNMDSAILNFRKENIVKTLDGGFVDEMIKEIKKQDVSDVDMFFVRIHSDGEFYSKEYLRKWILISWKIKSDKKFEGREKISFVAYTKAYKFLKEVLEDEERELHDMYKSVFGKKINREFTFDDFEIKFIISRMPSTDVNEQYYSYLVNSMHLPVYYVSKQEKFNCKTIACVDCQKCYPCTGNIRALLRT
jgi:hypothetical protein